MKTYRYADSKVYEPDSPESLNLRGMAMRDEANKLADAARRHGIALGIGKVADALSKLEDAYNAEEHGQYREGFSSGYRAALADIRGKILEMLREK